MLEEQKEGNVLEHCGVRESGAPSGRGLFVGQGKECGVYSRLSGQPLERFKLESDMS